MIDFSYQKKAAKQVLNNALNDKLKASVLAACPSAGKTTISHDIVNQYIKLYPTARIVVLTEGQKTLKNQYLNELENSHIKINFTYGEFGSDAQVRVGLPQSIGQLGWNSFDLLIVDEAHNFYFAQTVQEILENYSPQHQILMTGSPTKYNSLNQTSKDKFGMYYISAEELKEKGVFSGVDIDVVQIPDRKDPRCAITSIMTKAHFNKDDVSKIMVACPTIAYAKEVGATLSNMGRNVAISTSKNDPNDKEIVRFKEGVADVLVVVGKGILGFNDKNITILVDLRSSDNLDSSYQLFARILRTHPKGIRKAYYRIADKDLDKQILTVHKMISLMKDVIFKGYNGKNLTIA